jgi:hypothetical protein
LARVNCEFASDEERSRTDVGYSRYYHFSIKHEATNPPGTSEHQIMFFESHFTELKVGIGSDKSALNWCIGGTSKWSTPFTAGTWYNFAYDINVCFISNLPKFLLSRFRG